MNSISIESKSNHNNKSISVFELIYSFLFLLSLLTVWVCYIKTLVLINKEIDVGFDKSGIYVFGFLGLVTCIQYAKIYFNIHKIETKSEDTNHFLHCYNSNLCILAEKSIRLLLAIIVLFSTKYLSHHPTLIQDYMPIFRKINTDVKFSNILQMGENYFVPLSFAFFC